MIQGIWLSVALLAPLALVAAQPTSVGSIKMQGVPPIPQALLERVAPYLETRSARLLGWLPAGGGIIRTRFASTDQLHLVAHPLGARHQLTFYEEPVRQAWVSPNRATAQLAFLRDRGGDENYGIYLLDLKTRATRELTEPGTRNGAPVWSPDGGRLAFYSNRRDGKNWDIYLAELDSQEPATAVLETEPDSGGWWPLDFSPDGSRLLVEQYFSINDARLWILDLPSNDLQRVALPPAGVNQAGFARDGGGLWVSVDAFGEFRQLVRLNPSSGEHDSLTDHLNWDVELFAQSDDGEWLAYTVNENGFSQLTVVNLSQGVELDLPSLPGARVDQLSFQPGGSALGLTVSDARAPGNVFRLDPQSAAPRFEQWTASEAGGLNTAHFSAAVSIQFPTFDQVNGQPRKLQALVYPPASRGPHPVLIDIHGGPEGQAKPSFDAALQLFVTELGFAVLRPNVRGSAGFGRSFLELDNGTRREDAVRDIGALLDFIATQPALDEKRVAVIGGSYGGYMVLASLARYSDRLLGGIDRVGISNFVSFLENTSDYRRALRRAEYGDETDPAMRAFLESISPTRQVDRLTSPLLIFQGRNDPRVPASESRQMVAQIEKAGGEIWYMEAQNEGHGIRRKANQRLYLAAVSYFLEQLLKRAR